jgi:predicted Zn-dependent peptidase
MTDSIRLTTLPSGLVVASDTMSRVETVSIGAYVHAGTRNESAAENGASHFLEHMAFKGTARRDAAAIAREIENVGGHINAYTAREQTAYYCKVLKEDAGLAADIIGDILCHSTLVPEEMERERGVILQEIGQANDTPDDIIFDHFQETCFPNQAMGRPTLGTEAVIEGMQREALTGYMLRHYGPSRMVVAAAGAIEHDALLEMAQAHFADLPAVTPHAPEAASYGGGEFREERELDQVHLVMGFPPPPTRTPTTTRCSCSPRCWAAACRRGCSRKSARSGASSIPSIPSPIPMTTPACSPSMPAPARTRWPSCCRSPSRS